MLTLLGCLLVLVCCCRTAFSYTALTNAAFKSVAASTTTTTTTITTTTTSTAVEAAVRGNTSSVPGVSSPNGYLIFEYYKYNPCEGEIEEKRAMALGACVPSGLRGEPYGPNYHYIFSNNSEGLVECYLYDDSECTKLRQKYDTFYFNNCSDSGDSVFYTYSAELPQFTIDYASVQQVQYRNTSRDNTTTSNATCDIQNATVLSYALYSNSCRQNCMFNNKWEYCTFNSCVEETANVTYFEQSYRTAYAPCDANDTLGFKVTTSNCDERITCYDPNDFLPTSDTTSSDSDGDDDGMNVGMIVGLVIGCVVVAGVVGLAAMVTYRRMASSDDDTQRISLQEPLTA